VKSFYSNVDLGDLIYSLLFAKIIGVEKYILDGDSGINKFNNVGLEFTRTLIQAQPFIKTVEKYSGQSYDFDYGSHPKNIKVKVGTNLVEYHASKFDIDWKRLTNPWLSAPKKDFNKKIIINRTPRYQNNYLMYHDFLRHINIKDCLFVGLETEWKAFCEEFKKPIDFYPSLDALDLASTINGCETFLGNQSLSCAIATGLGKNCIIEVGVGCANYIFNNKKTIYF
jgi:hypothetical protein